MFDLVKFGLKGGCYNGEIGLIVMFLKKVKVELFFNWENVCFKWVYYCI